MIAYIVLIYICIKLQMPVWCTSLVVFGATFKLLSCFYEAGAKSVIDKE